MEKCSQCGYEIKEGEFRCPRCFKSLIHLGGCTNCGKCKEKSLLNKVNKKMKND
ncbi:hypothetical protein SAMN00017405_1405 [Desulfonispora thiosulfatigenes DSM 11270]|uniref:Double zinc ribbon n=1 Tax=Desulfonispora thiosulfatigenes DSM 11270 TaxID=656914 RepID=A0A1W1VCB8_DESTI|nr:hypothetical protein [Desulfonispora thiosulfatigenes]SMB91018.1 hypothetical protein SAMN00017405_1405 [Desulfonispora thiosulfatigenes DSM 11270]